MFEPNPLNLFGLRRVEHCPPHFFAVDFHIATDDKRISDWIFEHLSGRFYFGDYYKLVCENTSTKSVIVKRAAFEIHSEGSYFAMLLSDINKF